MIDRSRFFRSDLIAPHAPRQMPSQGRKGGTTAGSITVLEVSDHERRSTRQGDLEGKRKLGISDSVLHDRMRTKPEHSVNAITLANGCRSSLI